MLIRKPGSNPVLSKQLQQIEKKEGKLLNKKESKLIEEKVMPFKQKLEEKIPQPISNALNTAFYKAFQMVFEKGTKYIERMSPKGKISLEHDVSNYRVEREITKKNIKIMDRQAKRRKLMNQSISTVEGAGLGFLGVGIPEIPVFISLLLKTIYEIALGYGFDYDSPLEKIYILNLICGGATKGEERSAYNTRVDELAEAIEKGFLVTDILESQIKETSKVLSDRLLLAKFTQGIMIVGVVGSITNYTLIHKISEYATIKYKKRYLIKKQ